MRFAFTDDQLAFRDAVRDLLAKECPPEVVRSAWPEGADAHGARTGDGARSTPAQRDKVWRDLAEMGVVGIGVSEANGGLGLSEVDWILLAEETGYAALPHPFVETACVGAPLLDATGEDPDLLAQAIGGDIQIGVAVLGSTQVAWGDAIGALLQVDAAPRSATPEPQAWSVTRVQGGIASGDQRPGDRTLAATLDGGRRVVQLQGWLAGSGVADGPAAARAFDQGALGTAAQLVGLGRRLLDLTVAYASERIQFGAPIGTQQAVKHHLADAAMKLRFAAPAVYAAAWELSVDAPTASRSVSMAKALASDAARFTAAQALQCHGAIGYTVEYDLHLYAKRAEALARCWGDASWHRRRVAVSLGI